MNKITTYITSLLVAAAVVLTPSLSFAKNNGNGGHGDNNNGHGNGATVAVSHQYNNNGNGSGRQQDQRSGNSNNNNWQNENSNSAWNRFSNSGNNNSGRQSNPSNPRSNSIFNRIERGFSGNTVDAATIIGNNDNNNNNGGGGSNTTTPGNLTPNISSIKAPTVLKTGQVGTWTVNASDPQNGSLTYAVDWGDSSLKPLAAAQPLSFTQTSTFTHAYDNSGVYTVTFTVSNDAGLQTTSTVTVNIIGGSVVNMPVISNLTATSNRPHRAMVTWTTDVPSTSLVWFSLTSPVNTSGNPNVSHSFNTTDHRINLGQLQPNTKYFVVVGSANSAGTAMSSETSFMTPAITSVTAPVITSLSGSASVPVGQTETVTINAYDPQNGSLTYSADWGDNSPMMLSPNSLTPIFNQTATLSHVYSAAGNYTATFTAMNDGGEKATSSMMITVTVGTTTPILTSVGVTPATPSVAVGGTVQLTATPMDQNSVAFVGATTTFSSSNTAVATVNSTTGLVTGVATGTATITATSVIGSTTVIGTATVTVM